MNNEKLETIKENIKHMFTDSIIGEDTYSYIISSLKLDALKKAQETYGNSNININIKKFLKDHLILDKENIYFLRDGKSYGIEDVCLIKHDDFVYYNDTSVLCASSNYINVFSKNKNFINYFNENIKNYQCKIEHYNPNIYMLTEKGCISIGNGGLSFNKSNYNQSVQDDYNIIIKDLNSKSPLGRLFLFQGEPGTGKTYFIRSLLTKVRDGVFIYVPSNMIDKLTSQSTINILAQYSQGKKLILIIEDCDSSLKKRAAKDSSKQLNSVSELLNLTDGIIGNLLDIRVLATTNLEFSELDDAVLRDGRLSKRISFEKLNKNDAESLYFNNTKQKISFEKDMTIAEIYRKIKEFKFNEKPKRIRQSKKQTNIIDQSNIAFAPVNSVSMSIKTPRLMSVNDLPIKNSKRK